LCRRSCVRSEETRRENNNNEKTRTIFNDSKKLIDLEKNYGLESFIRVER
jgi:hypothetical protein